jgi:hypothetical protein
MGILSVLSFSPLSTSRALTSFGDDCLSCHTSSGLVVSPNVTSIVVQPNDSFWIEVTAVGGDRDMLLVWSNVSHNGFFSFSPNEVEDNDVYDEQSEEGTITTRVMITAPQNDGNYTLTPNAATSGAKGGSANIEVQVGTGGEIIVSLTLFELVMGLFTTTVPIILILLAVLGVALYVITWRQMPVG